MESSNRLAFIHKVKVEKSKGVQPQVTPSWGPVIGDLPGEQACRGVPYFSENLGAGPVACLECLPSTYGALGLISTKDGRGNMSEYLTLLS